MPMPTTTTARSSGAGGFQPAEIDARRRPVGLGEDAGQLAVGRRAVARPHEVVGPLQPRARTPATDSTAAAAATATAIVARSTTGAGGRSRTDSSRPAPGGAVHVRPGPAAAGGLVVGHQHDALGLALAGQLQRVGVGRAGLATQRTSAKRAPGPPARADLARPPGTQVTIWRAHQGPHRQPGRDRRPGHPRLPGARHRHGGGVLRARPRGAARPAGRRGLRARRARPRPRATSTPSRSSRSSSESGADGVHPGYGFFSENTDFARAITERGVTFIGPPPEAIEVMGDKVSSRIAAQEAGVAGRARHHRVPHRRRRGRRLRRGVRLAGRHQGRLRRRRPRHAGRAERPTRPHAALESAQSEALKGFGRDECYVERYLTWPRHVEMQIIADTHGNVRVGRRARLLGPAPPPEADRGEPGARPSPPRSARPWARPP